MSILERCLNGEYEIGDDAAKEIMRLRTMIRCLSRIVTDEYPIEDDRYGFAKNCLTEIGEKDECA